jgi:hypothetical protein
MLRPEATAIAARVTVAVALLLAWLNFLLTTRWATVPGSLHGAREPWYAAALLTATVLLAMQWRSIGRPVSVGRVVPAMLLIAGASVLVAAFTARLPPSQWNQIPFKDNWTELFQQAVNGVRLMYRGSVVGWNWGLQGGYPTSTDIAQNFAALAIVPMTLAGDRVGYHLLHACVLAALPLLVWWDLRREDSETALLAAGFATVFTAGYVGWLGNSGDTNSLVGVFCATLALAGGRAASLGHRWGGPLLLLALTLGLYSHVAFVVYAGIYLLLEAACYRDRPALMRLALASVVAVLAALPIHWESLRHSDYVSFNNTVYDPATPRDWPVVLKSIYYNVEILLRPGRWFNDYRSLANIWWIPVAVVAVVSPRSRVGFYAWATVLTQALLRINTPEAGAIFDRIQHMFPVIIAPAIAGLVRGLAGTRMMALGLVAVIGLYVATSFVPIRHVPELRAFNPPLIDRMTASEGMVLVEISPHRDMDKDPVRRTPTTPFDVHFEGLLPDLAGQRFYSQMIDGWGWNIWRGQVVAAGTFEALPIAETPPPAFASEMRRWGVRHLFVWTDATRSYLRASDLFVERWRDERWSHFELIEADTRTVVTVSGGGRLRNLDFLGGEVELEGVAAGDLVVLRTNYYPAWRAYVNDREVPLRDADGQLAFNAPRAGSYVVRLVYPRYRGVSAFALLAFIVGGVVLWRGTPAASVSAQ